MNATDLPGKMMSLQLKEKAIALQLYMPFLEHGGLFVPTDDIFSLGDEVLLAVGNHRPSQKIPAHAGRLD